MLIDYAGTVLLVSHDREFLDNVVTRCLAFEGHGHVGDYVGGYKDWLRQRPAVATPVTPARSAAPVKAPVQDKKQQRELAELPGRIEKLESEQAVIHEKLADPELYTRERDKARALQDRAAAIERELGEAYRRWEVLEQS